MLLTEQIDTSGALRLLRPPNLAHPGDLCSALADTKEKKSYLFYAFNFENLQKDFAKGHGEYLKCFLRALVVSRILRKNYQMVLKPNISFCLIAP